MHNVINENGIITSNVKWTPPPPLSGSLYQMLDAKLQQRLDERDWVFLRDGITMKELKASDADLWIKRISSVLTKYGFKKGDTLHLVATDSLYYVCVMMAVWRLGGVSSCGHPDLNAKTIRNQLEQLKCKFVLCLSGTADRVKEAVANDKDVTIFSLDHDQGTVDLLEESMHVDVKGIPAPVDMGDKEDPVLVIWSSGTTGVPKGICHSHDSLWNALGVAPPPPKTTLSTLTFFHFSGCLTLILGLSLGTETTHLSPEGLSLLLVLERIKEMHPTSLELDSCQYAQLSNIDPKQHGFTPSSDFAIVERQLHLGAAVPFTVSEKMNKMFPNAANICGYGASEIGGIALSTNSSDHFYFIWVGREMKIVEVDTRKVCKPHQTGEIVVKAPTTMIGYLNRPKSDFFDEDGFGRTGDLAYYDENAHIYLVGRMKEIIKYGTHHISPKEIEDIAYHHPCILECAAFGIDQPLVNEEVSLAVVRVPGSEVSADDIKAFVNERVDHDWKRIRGKVIFTDSLPRNKVGKIMRMELKKKC